MSCDTLLAFFQIPQIDVLKVVHFFVALYLSISLHEAAHAWMANRCGDDTARLMGRMTLNPIVHIDPIGTVVMPLLMTFNFGFPLIGWAKPVPVNPLRFRNYHRDQILVSIAGPVSNFMLAVGSLIVCWIVMAAFDVRITKGWEVISSSKLGQVLFLFLFRLLMLNLVLGLFNLIPIPPLDGSHVLRIFISREAAEKMERFLVPPFNFIILIGVLVVAGGPVFGLLRQAAFHLVRIW